MFDETQNKIIDAAMSLIMERGYASTTTKDIASRAGVNECTIFRRFQGKKEIVLAAMTLDKWNPGLSVTDFVYEGDLEKDLTHFSQVYMKKVTPHMVKVSIGLRTPELYPDTAEGILKVPKVFKNVLTAYFEEMGRKGRLGFCYTVDSPSSCEESGLNDSRKVKPYESMAMMFLSMNFGFVFLNASFGEQLTDLDKEQYIRESVHVFVQGIGSKRC